MEETEIEIGGNEEDMIRRWLPCAGEDVAAENAAEVNAISVIKDLRSLCLNYETNSTPKPRLVESIPHKTHQHAAYL